MHISDNHIMTYQSTRVQYVLNADALVRTELQRVAELVVLGKGHVAIPVIRDLSTLGEKA